MWLDICRQIGLLRLALEEVAGRLSGPSKCTCVLLHTEHDYLVLLSWHCIVSNTASRQVFLLLLRGLKSRGPWLNLKRLPSSVADQRCRRHLVQFWSACLRVLPAPTQHTRQDDL